MQFATIFYQNYTLNIRKNSLGIVYNEILKLKNLFLILFLQTLL